MKQRLFSVLAVIWLCGCAAPLPTAPVKPAAVAGLQPGDRIRVIVFGEDALSGVYSLDTAGDVTLPLIGAVRVSGLTLDACAHRIATRLRQDYLQDPKVAVSLDGPRDVYVLGEVQRAGNYGFTPSLTVLQAVAKAGGYSYRASHTGMIVSRPDPAKPGQITKYQATEDTLLLPGDSLIVQERYF